LFNSFYALYFIHFESFETLPRQQESLTDYTRRFKTTRDLLVTQLGGPINKNDKQEMRKCQEKVFEQFLAYTYLDSSDKAKYGS
jgi:hypothetical protein